MASVKDFEAQVAKQDTPVVITLKGLDLDPYKGLDGKPTTMSVVGNESKRMRAFDERRREQRRFGRIDEFDEEKDRIERAAHAVVAWSGFDDGTADIPHSERAVREVLSGDGAGHILNQVEAAIVGHGIFSKASSAS